MTPGAATAERLAAIRERLNQHKDGLMQDAWWLDDMHTLLSCLDRLTAASGDHRAVAEKLVEDWVAAQDAFFVGGLYDSEIASLTSTLTQAITAAVAAETEACAKVAEDYDTSKFGPHTIDGSASITARKIAQDIRSRREETTR